MIFLLQAQAVSHTAWIIARPLESNVLRGGNQVEIATLHDDATVSLPPLEAISFSLGDL